jgi:lambda family phage portal protein
MKEITVRGRTIRENVVDRVVSFFDPSRGLKRLHSRAVMAVAGSWIGASYSRRQTSQWKPWAWDADTDIVFDLNTLRSRSRDLVRSNPIARGAVETNLVNVVGPGLSLQSRINRDILNLTDDQADAWESAVELEWKLFFESREADCARILSGPEIANLVFRSTLESGDAFTNLPRFKRGMTPYQLRLQVIEADRVNNEDGRADSLKLVQGVEKDDNGAPIRYHVQDQHPGMMLPGAARTRTWQKIDAWGPRTGLPNILHHYRPTRPGQTRGVPYLAPVIEQLKMIDRYSEAELMAAVVSAMFTVFIKSQSGEFPAPMQPTTETGGTSTDTDYKLATGAIVGLAAGEEIQVADPKRPNTSFDPFFLAITRQIGIALGIPYEVLIKHFTASYSAARAALLDAWKHFTTWRTWLVGTFYQPVYEIFLYEAIAQGRIAAPGFFADPLVRLAYSGARWIGPSPGQINPTDEVNAAEKRLSLAISTRAEETAALTGGDFEGNLRQIRKEKKALEEAGIPWGPAAKAAAAPAERDEDVEERKRREMEEAS